MKEKQQSPAIDPELEARIVAMVLGEASDFERDQLLRLIDEQPELASFKAEIETVHGLLDDVETGEKMPADDWKLPTQRREALLAVISGEAEDLPKVDLAKGFSETPFWRRRAFLTNLTVIAAGFCLVAFLGSMAVPALRMSAARDSRNKQIGLATGNYRYQDENGQAVQSVETDGEWFSGGEDSSYGDHIEMSDGAVTMIPNEESLSEFAAAVTAESDSKGDSKSALADIRNNLNFSTSLPSPHYLQDDVQYYPVQPQQETPQDSYALGGAGMVEGRARTPDDGASVGLGTGLADPAKGSWARDNSTNWRTRIGNDGNVDVAGESEVRERVAGATTAPATQPLLALPTPKLESGSRSEASEQSSARTDLRGGTELRYSMDLKENETRRFGDDAFRAQSASESEGIAIAGTDGSGGYDVELSDRLADPGIAVGGMGGAGSFGGGAALQKSGTAGTGEWAFGEDKTSELDAIEDAEMPHTPPPTNRPSSGQQSSSGPEAAKRKIVNSVQDQFAMDAATMPTADGFGMGENNNSGKNSEDDANKPVPSASTAVVEARPERRIAPDNPMLKYQTPALPQGGPAGVTRQTVVPNRYRENAELFFDSLPSTPETSSPQFSDATTRDFKDSLAAAAKKSPAYRFLDSENSSESGSQFWGAIEKFSVPAGLDEKNAGQESFSTFSLHVSDVSYKLARAALASGQWPEAARIRIEEFVNAFDYGDPMPRQSERVAARVEQSIHPFLQQRNLLRISMRTAAAGRASNTPLRLTLLLDNSGSMERIDRQQTVRRAFALLAQQLKPIDQVTLISFARQPRLLADKVSGDQSHQLVEFIDNLPSEGGTNLEAALQLAFEKAKEQEVENAQNRIILLTDGAVNLGDANPESLSNMIESMRTAGIAFDAAGISAEGLNDEILEALTRKGDGRYYLLDSLEDADDGFARQIAGALRPSAKNVKVQVEFNPKRVGNYKLLGFEKHRLKQEDFRNDKVDAAEMAAAEAGVAVYQFQAKPDGEGDVGSVSVRFRDLSTGRMIENCWPIPYEADAPRIDQAAPSLRIATAAAMLAAKLRGEAIGETVDLKVLSNLIAGLPSKDRQADRVVELRQMIEQARQLSGQ